MLLAELTHSRETLNVQGLRLIKAFIVLKGLSGLLSKWNILQITDHLLDQIISITQNLFDVWKIKKRRVFQAMGSDPKTILQTNEYFLMLEQKRSRCRDVITKRTLLDISIVTLNCLHVSVESKGKSLKPWEHKVRTYMDLSFQSPLWTTCKQWLWDSREMEQTKLQNPKIYNSSETRQRFQNLSQFEIMFW